MHVCECITSRYYSHPMYTCSIFTCQIIKLGGSKFLECSCSSANMNCMYRKYFIQVLKVLVLSAYKFNKCLSFILNMYFTILSFLIENQLKKNKLYTTQSLNSYPLNVIIYFLLDTLGLTGYFFSPVYKLPNLLPFTT